MTTNDKKLLHDLLLALANKWGFETVEQQLVELRQTNASADHHDVLATKALRRQRNPRNRRANVSDIVSKFDVSQERKDVLLKIARRYEERDFLPSMGDVEHFLMMNGTVTRRVSDRRAAFRTVLNVVSNFSDEMLNKVARGDAYNGPAQLGPLSDAISAANASLRPTKDFSEDPVTWKPAPKK
jgi:hypothetical protein